MTATQAIIPAEDRAMTRAFELARLGPRMDPNPQVGCVILDARGRAVAEGYHQGKGTPHAELAALEDLRRRGNPSAGTTMVVSLEPCRHTGATPPCTSAIIGAGITRVLFSAHDPQPHAGGGEAVLREAGIDVVAGVREAEGEALIRHWSVPARLRRPYVIAKLATSLDGRIAAADGTSKWISGIAAREHAHRVRAEVAGIVVGIGTVLADDPLLTARVGPQVDGGELGTQTSGASGPVRIVMGMRDIPAGARIRGPGGELVHLRTHDPLDVLQEAWRRGLRSVLIEGGGAVTGAFVGAGLVDEVHSYIAPVLLGHTRSAVEGWAAPTLSMAPRWRLESATTLGDDILIIAHSTISNGGDVPACSPDSSRK